MSAKPTTSGGRSLGSVARAAVKLGASRCTDDMTLEQRVATIEKEYPFTDRGHRPFKVWLEAVTEALGPEAANLSAKQMLASRNDISFPFAS